MTLHLDAAASGPSPGPAVEGTRHPDGSRLGRATLVIGPSWVGDLVMAQSLFQRLKEAEPTVPIDVVSPAWGAALLARMPEVRRWVDAQTARGVFGLRERFRAGSALKGRYATAYVLPGSWKSALVPLFAQVPRRIGYRGEWRYGLLSECRPLPPGLRRKTAEAFAGLGGGGAFAPPRLRVDAANQAAVLQRFGLGSRPFAAFMPGADYGPAKRWPARHYATLARSMAERGFAVVLFGSAADAAVGSAIVDLAPAVIDLCGLTRIDDAVDLLGAAEVAVTNDSGLMHVAAAVGTPVVAVYGSTSPDHTPPLSERSDTVTLRLPCAPCHDRHCRFGHTDCLERLEAATVLAAVDRLTAPSS